MRIALRGLLIIAMLLWPACLMPTACAAMTPMPATPVQSPAKKLSGDCCGKGCHCGASAKSAGKDVPIAQGTPEIAKVAAAPLLLITMPSAATIIPVAPAASVEIATPRIVRAQSRLCLWTT